MITIKNYISMVYRDFKDYIDKSVVPINYFENCVNDAEKYLNRCPVMKARNIRYQVLSFI